ncbi:lauroyl/myristoyl acyltransferase [Paraburkholderia sp. GAS448]
MLAADMDHGADNSVLVPVVGVPACTPTLVSRLARLSHERVVPFVTEVARIADVLLVPIRIVRRRYLAILGKIVAF